MDRYEIREELKENIDYDHLRNQCPYDDVESLLELMVDVVSSTASTIRIGGEVLPLDKQKEYEERTKARKKAEIEARKQVIRTGDIARGVFVPVSSMPKLEPRKGA